ncbi:MAG TPA: PAS domain-containing protein, partial [Solirubrobacteraceae bacterium]|nr:PAS domain-containing protein [Solirubrobacteraceae bacterium]
MTAASLVLALVALLGIAVYAVRLRRAAAALREALTGTAARGRHVLEAVAEGIYVVDERGTIVHANAGAHRLLNARVPELVGRALEEIVDPLVSELLPDVRYARRTGKPLERTYALAERGAALEVRVTPAGHETIVTLR